MKKIVALLLAAVVIAAGVYFVPKFVHTCDDCENFFFGTGYTPSDLLGLVSGDDAQEIICKSCAEEQHALAIAVGGSVEDYKIDPFAPQTKE